MTQTFRVRIRSQLVKYIFHENVFFYLCFGSISVWVQIKHPCSAGVLYWPGVSLPIDVHATHVTRLSTCLAPLLMTTKGLPFQLPLTTPVRTKLDYDKDVPLAKPSMR